MPLFASCNKGCPAILRYEETKLSSRIFLTMLIANINASYWWINNQLLTEIPIIIHIIIITIIITIVK